VSVGDGDVRRALSGVEALYGRSLAEHGTASPAVGWPDPDAHRLRFEKLAHVLEADRAGGPIVVNDWGCGYGALFHHLDARDDVELAGYHGYDVSAAMLAAAERHVADARARWVRSPTITRDADYGFACGLFNVRLGADAAEWGAHVRGGLRTLHATSRRGFAFNLLTSHVDWREDHLYYADPSELLAFCQDELSPRVALLHDYPLYEFTVAVLRADAAPAR
jgi:hypothetical protein